MAGGSGAAGLPAAIEARRRGLYVLLACKGPIGRGTSTSFADGRFTVATPWDGVELDFRDTLEAGRYLNNEALATMLVREERRAVNLLTKFGLELHPAPKGWHLLLGAGHPYIAGIALSRTLVGAAGVLTLSESFGYLFSGRKRLECRG